jgi:hypothetical protein
MGTISGKSGYVDVIQRVARVVCLFHRIAVRKYPREFST